MHIKKVLLILTLCLLLVTVSAYAQDATAEATAEVSQTVAPEAEPLAGLPSLVLLLGLGAVAAVGGMALMRQRTNESGAVE